MPIKHAQIRLAELKVLKMNSLNSFEQTTNLELVLLQ